MIGRAVAWLRRESGSAIASLVFVFVGAALVASVVVSATNIISYTGASRTLNSTSAAVDERLGQWAALTDAGQVASTDQACFPALGSCVTITQVVPNPTGATLTLVSESQDQTFTRTRVYTAPAAPHIIGFDTGGLPVWN